MTARAVPVSVPGKLFLLGEYAVLGGGASVVTTVDRHIHVRCRDDAQGYRIVGSQISDPLRLPILVKQVLADQADLDVDPNQLTVDVGEFFEGDEKLGLGSSAASTVALVAALAPHLEAGDRFALAFEIHRQLQGGRGSGADIAASTYGGPLAYQLNAPHPPFHRLNLPTLAATDEGPHPQFAFIDRDLSFPKDLRIDAVWTGSPARSTSFVDGLADTLAAKRADTTAILKSIASGANAGIAALREGDTSQFLKTLRRGDRLMEKLGDLTGLPIITDTHRRIRALARTTDRIAKPSGAGGGDFTLLVGQGESPVPPSVIDQYPVIKLH